MKHKEDLITPPRLTKPKPKVEEKLTLHLERNGKPSTLSINAADEAYWRKKLSKTFTIIDTPPDTCSGHECFKKNTGVACSRCKH